MVKKQKEKVFEAAVLAAQLGGEWGRLVNLIAEEYDEKGDIARLPLDRKPIRDNLFEVLEPREEVVQFMTSQNLLGDPDKEERRRRILNMILDPVRPAQIKYVNEAERLARLTGVEKPALIDIPGVFPLYQLLRPLRSGRDKGLLRELHQEADEPPEYKFVLAFSGEELDKLRDISKRKLGPEKK